MNGARPNLARLEEEHQKLVAAEREFASYMENLRRAKDREEFDRFMSARRNGGTEPAATDGVIFRRPADTSPAVSSIDGRTAQALGFAAFDLLVDAAPLRGARRLRGNPPLLPLRGFDDQRAQSFERVGAIALLRTKALRGQHEHAVERMTAAGQSFETGSSHNRRATAKRAHRSRHPSASPSRPRPHPPPAVSEALSQA